MPDLGFFIGFLPFHARINTEADDTLDVGV
jgi:hypothetical protein